MPYDAFISYSRADEAWARKLYEELATARGFKVFLDEKRLTAGDKWDSGLYDGLLDSRHFLLLWSDSHAKDSEWVREEASSFRILIHKDFREGKPAYRRFIQICLEGRSDRYAEFQTASLGKDSSQYQAGPASVNPNAWQNLVEAVTSGLDRGENLPLVNQVVLASTASAIGRIPGNHKPTTRAESFDDLLARVGIKTRAEVVARYGEERCAWHPFGCEKNILTILNQLRAEALARGIPPFRWQPVGDEFWTGTKKQVDAIIDRLCSEQSVIVLDALSLYDMAVYEQYDRLLEVLANQSAALMVLPPFSHDVRCRLRDFLENAAEKLFDQYYRPKLGRRVAAQCNVIADDEIEMGRLLQYVVSAKPAQRHRVVRVK